MEEIWKPVVGCDGYYEVSNTGRVRAMFEGNHGQYKIGRILKLTLAKNGYWRVELNVPNRKPFKMTVHTMVLEAFRGPRPDGQDGRHLDGVRSNSNVNNLEWGTKSQNMQDSIRHGTFIMGERHHQSKLTNEDIITIRELRQQGLTLKAIAHRFGIDQSNVAYIAKRITWTHI
jgi:YesN/AraC family two-component response regulator